MAVDRIETTTGALALRWALALICLVLLAPPFAAGVDLQSFPGCRMVKETWADGDSFPVRFPDGKMMTIRLYGVDCVESHIGRNDANARRLLDQRRWFGIEKIEDAQQIGLDGKKETERLLGKPFTVHTSFSDARGDARYSRIYGFVTLADGRDLSEYLVSVGYARAFGVVRTTPDGTRGEEWRERLKDLELRASRIGAGAWELTNWSRLPEERREARRDEDEIAVARQSASAKKTILGPIDLNSASLDDLMGLPGVGEIMALRIVENRPYQNVEDLMKVSGIGPKSLEKIRSFVLVKKSNSKAK